MNRLIELMSRIRVIFCGLVLLISGCSGKEEKQALVAISNCRPTVDGKVDECWKELPYYPIDGSLVGEINWDGKQDLSAEFRVLMHDEDLFFLVKVTDDIEGRIESSLQSQYWENDNVEFFFTNNIRMAQGELSKEDSIYFVNYSSSYNRLEKMVNIPDSKAVNVSFGRTDFEGGFLLEARFDKELGVFDFDEGSIPFNIELSDNDNINNEEGFIKGRESGLAWSYNSARSSWLETINYGELVVEQ